MDKEKTQNLKFRQLLSLISSYWLIMQNKWEKNLWILLEEGKGKEPVSSVETILQLGSFFKEFYLLIMGLKLIACYVFFFTCLLIIDYANVFYLWALCTLQLCYFFIFFFNFFMRIVKNQCHNWLLFFFCSWFCFERNHLPRKQICLYIAALGLISGLLVFISSGFNYDFHSQDKDLPCLLS